MGANVKKVGLSPVSVSVSVRASFTVRLVYCLFFIIEMRV